MRLLYPLTVTFGEVRPPKRAAATASVASSRNSLSPVSVVRIKCLALRAFSPADRHDPCREPVFVADEVVQLPWPHHFYVLVNQQNLALNLQRLHWLTHHALHGFNLRRRRPPRRSPSSSSSSPSPSSIFSRAACLAAGRPSADRRADHDLGRPLAYEPVLYDLDSSLTSLYDTCSMFDNWQRVDRSVSLHDHRVSHNDRHDPVDGASAAKRARRTPGSRGCQSAEAAAVGDVTLLRRNDLYRVRLQTMAQYRFLFEYFRDNAHYWQHQFSVPVNLLHDQFRYALDVYVANLRLKIMRDTLARSGLLESSIADAAGVSAAGTTGGSELYRKVLQRLQENNAHRPAEQLSTDPLDMRRWFSCGKWCLFDLKRACVSLVPAEEFVGCVRTLQNLTVDEVSDRLLGRLHETPLDFLPRVVWDIETIAPGKGTIPRGVTEQQRLSSIALVVERPALEAGRAVVLYVLAPEHMTCAQIESLDLGLIGESSEELRRLAVRSTRVLVYRDERALLLDFLLDMTTNHSLLSRFLGVRRSAMARYQDLASLLVGHNSIEYDFAFLLDRCVFFDLREFLPFLLSLRRHANLSRSLSHSWVFNEAQICVDTMQFLQARNRQLKSYKLANVLRVYGCAIEKIDFSAVEIRSLYYAPVSSSRDSLAFMRDILRYNVFDCLSLCDLLGRVSFAHQVTLMMAYFFTSLDVAMYKGNSSLLPTLVQLDDMQVKREVAVIRQPQCNNFLCSSARVDRSVYRENRRLLERRCRLRLLLEPAPDSRSILCSDNPYTALLNYHRVLRVFALDDRTAAATGFPPIAAAPATARSVFRRVPLEQLHTGHATLTPHNEMELLRVGEKTYIGGMNFASPSHSKYPVLADYNSFYPSIIRSYALDVCKVAVMDLKQILLTVPIPLLECLLFTRVLRLFDYTSLEDRDHAVNLDRHRELFAGDEWHEAVEYTTFEQLVYTSRHLGRRFLSLVYTPDPSTVDGIATKALERRAVWKQKRREQPNDVVVEYMEMMEKLLANSLYGYMNFSLSAIFSRATAAAVTLLCRNAFCRTRRIIESRDLVASTLLDPDRFRFRVIYIDTDGCIFVLTRLQAAAESSAADAADAVARPPAEPWFRLYANLQPADTAAVYRRLIGEVNRRLDLRYVTLAAEHEDAFAVCVFAKKKYALLKAPHGTVKKTGFESNAAKPIRHMYDLLLRNTLRAFHIYRLVDHQRFVVTIRHHRLFFFAIFDYLHALWRRSCREVRGPDDQGAAEVDDNNDDDGDNDDGATPLYTLQDFCQSRPLNPKDNRGEMSLFIDRVLCEFCYSAGERVAILKIVDPQTAVRDNVLYPQRGRFVLKEELEGVRMRQIVPNLHFFLGCYTRYFYQCVEGHQTLRGSARQTREPIEPGYYLASFNAIFEYSWACWLYCRVYARSRSKLRGVFWPRTGSPSPAALSAARQTTLPGGGGDRRLPLPTYLPRAFFADKDCPPAENPFYRNLFSAAEVAAADSSHDMREKRRFVESDRYLRVDPLRG